MSKDSKPTKKATVSEDTKPAEKGAVSEDSNPMKRPPCPTTANLLKRVPCPTTANLLKRVPCPTTANRLKRPPCAPTEKAIVSNDVKPTEKGTAGETPVFDFTKLMSQFRLPGVDFAALVDRERKNIEALAKANSIAFEGWQRLVRRQAEMLQETMKKVVADARQEDAKKKRADLAKEGFEKALANMRELAEITTQSQKEAFDVVRKRIEENVEGIRNFGKKAGK